MTKFEEFKNRMEAKFKELIQMRKSLLAGDMSDCMVGEEDYICRIRLNAEIDRMQWVVEMLPENID